MLLLNMAYIESLLSCAHLLTGKNDKKLQLNDKDLEEPHTTKSKLFFSVLWNRSHFPFFCESSVISIGICTKKKTFWWQHNSLDFHVEVKFGEVWHDHIESVYFSVICIDGALLQKHGSSKMDKVFILVVSS